MLCTPFFFLTKPVHNTNNGPCTVPRTSHFTHNSPLELCLWPKSFPYTDQFLCVTHHWISSFCPTECKKNNFDENLSLNFTHTKKHFSILFGFNILKEKIECGFHAVLYNNSYLHAVLYINSYLLPLLFHQASSCTR